MAKIPKTNKTTLLPLALVRRAERWHRRATGQPLNWSAFLCGLTEARINALEKREASK